MRASLCFGLVTLGLCVAACSGNDISIGNNDSGGNPGNDSSTGQDGGDGQDTGTGMDSGQGQDSGDPGDSGGQDSGIVLDSGPDGCTAKVFQFQCGNGLCSGGELEYCSPYPHACKMMPLACKCNYTCACLLQNAPPCIQGSLKCSGGNGNALYLTCN